jgi:hypothetical protein
LPAAPSQSNQTGLIGRPTPNPASIRNALVDGNYIYGLYDALNVSISREIVRSCEFAPPIRTF